MGQQIKDIELLKKIAKRLKNLRVEKNLTQEMVYNDTEIHIARIESGQQNVSVSTLYALCKYYSVTLREFFIEDF